MQIRVGFKEKDRIVVAQLYANAFKRKFEKLIGDEDEVASLLEKRLNSNYCLTCYHNEQLVGLAGFHVDHKALVNISLSNFISQFGFFKGLMKGIIAAIIFYRKPVPKNELLMDGIAVDEKFRGQGIGSRLFDELFEWAKANDYKAVHLDVIDENPKAKALYKRLGFEEMSYEKVPRFIEKLIGVSGITHMRKAV